MKKLTFLYVFFGLFWLGIWKILQWSMMEAINNLFIIGLISALVAASVKIMQSGFLELFLSGFRKIGQMMTVRSHAMERAEERLQNDASLQAFKKQVGEWIFHATAACAVVSMSLSVAVLIVYY